MELSLLVHYERMNKLHRPTKQNFSIVVLILITDFV
jgi:hypothetical protein